MKILLLNANLRGIGTYTRALHFGRAFTQAGHSVTLCTVSPTNRWHTHKWSENGITVLEMPRSGYKALPGRGSGWLDIIYRIKMIYQGNFECIYGFEYQPDVAWPIYITQRRQGYRFFSDWCDWHAGGANVFRQIKLAHRIDGYFEEKIRFLAEGLTVISNVLRNRAISIGIPIEKISLIEEGVDTNFIRPLPMNEMRSKFGLSTRTPLIVTITDSDMNLPVEILAKVRQTIPNTELLVIGRRDPDVFRTAIRLGVQSFVHETGYVQDIDIPCLLACADVCFLPMKDNLANRSRWPQKINDFLAAGKPTIISPVGDIVNLFLSHSIGALAITVDEFADKISQYIWDFSLTRYMAENARSVAETVLDWRVLYKKINKVISG